MKTKLTLSLFCLAGMAFGAQQAPKPTDEWEMVERFIANAIKILDQNKPQAQVKKTAEAPVMIMISEVSKKGHKKILPFEYNGAPEESLKVADAIAQICISTSGLKRNQDYINVTIAADTQKGTQFRVLLLERRLFPALTITDVKQEIDTKGLQGLCERLRTLKK